MSETQLYAKFKHTVGCRTEYGESSDAEWYDLDIYSDSDDPKTALETYLHDEYDGVGSVKGGVYTVKDPDSAFPVVRQYRLK